MREKSEKISVTFINVKESIDLLLFELIVWLYRKTGICILGNSGKPNGNNKMQTINFAADFLLHANFTFLIIFINIIHNEISTKNNFLHFFREFNFSINKADLHFINWINL